MNTDEESSAFGRQQPSRYGDDIIEPGEPYTDATLDTIRAILADGDPVPEAKPLKKIKNTGRSDAVSRCGRQAPHSQEITAQHADQPSDQSARNQAAAEGHLVSAYAEMPLEPKRSWRQIEVVEGRTGRSVRRFIMSPRLVSVVFLSGVVIWQPWFIPMLVLLGISSLLLIGALIGQDRMARILLYLLKRFVWADPSLGRLLQRVLPRRWHPVLYRPTTRAPTWDGPIDPSFAQRLSRIR